MSVAGDVIRDRDAWVRTKRRIDEKLEKDPEALRRDPIQIGPYHEPMNQQGRRQ